jgi:hypothetical protein
MREKYTQKIRQELEKIQRSVHRGRIQEPKDVHKRVAKAFGHKQAQKYFTYDVRPLTPQEIRTLPRPARRCRRPTLVFSYRYEAEKVQHDAPCDGVYALLTNAPAPSHSTDALFGDFKEQHHIETAHHQWKAPIRLRPLFLKSLRRLESLVFVQFVALMAFYLVQRRYRLACGAGCRTTGETLLRRFAHCPLAFRHPKGSIAVLVHRLLPRQEHTLAILGLPPIAQQIQAFVSAGLEDPLMDQQADLADQWDDLENSTCGKWP